MAANNTRESVAQNNVRNARDAVKRFPEHRDLCRKFVSTFESSSEERHPKFGQRKYKNLLQAASNLRRETIFIDLQDVEDFCKKEIQDPHSQFSQSKLSTEDIVTDIETNTLRYERYFYEACSEELPGHDSNFDAEGGGLARELVQKWRQKQVEQVQAETGQVVEFPKQLQNTFNIRFMPRPNLQPLKLRDINAAHVGGIVKLDCLVLRVSSVKPKVEVVTYNCEICGAEIYQIVEGDQYSPPKECASQRCRDNKQSGKLNQNLRTCKFVRFQEVRVQEMSQHVPVGGVPRSMNVVLGGDLTRTILPGDAVTITGVYVPRQLPWFQARQKGTMQEMYIDAHHIFKHKTGYNETGTDQSAVSRKVDEVHAQGNLYEMCSRSIAPEIFGHADVKKALLLALVGSFTKTMKDGMKIRGDIHTLLMGDPGVAKSQLMKQACNIAPRSVYTTGKGSSGVGLTASVKRDDQTGEVSLEGGALVLADMGVCCIDEFDKMEESDRTAIHEVMEQQSISIAKAGITTTLNCRTTVLAAANPKMGRYNPYIPPVDNIDLPPALLSRFDLLFLLLDTVDSEKDKKLAMHVCKVHTSYKAEAEQKKDAGGSGDGEDADVLNLGFKTFDATFMRAFIRKAKTFEPMIDDELQRDIVDAYVSIRDDEKRGDMDSRKSYTTPRTLLGILRLSQAHARCRFSTRVERQDFDEAMRLTKASKESVELSGPAKKDQNPLDIVYDLLSDMVKSSSIGEGWVDMTHLVSMAGHKAMSKDAVVEAVENWESLSVLTRNPEKTMVKFLVPP